MSLTKCIKKAGKALDRDDADAIRGLRDGLVADGVGSVEAGIEAVRLHIQDVLAERDAIVSQVEEQGGTAPEAPDLTNYSAGGTDAEIPDGGARGPADAQADEAGGSTAGPEDVGAAVDGGDNRGARASTGGSAPADGAAVSGADTAADGQYSLGDRRIGAIAGKGHIKGKFLGTVDGKTIPGGALNSEAEALEAARRYAERLDQYAEESAQQESAQRDAATKILGGENPTKEEWLSTGLVEGWQVDRGYVYQPDISGFLVEHLGVPKNNIRKNIGAASGVLRNDMGGERPIVYLGRLADVFGHDGMPALTEDATGELATQRPRRRGKPDLLDQLDSLSEQAAGLPVAVTAEDLPYQDGYEAYRNISHTPEDRALQEQIEYLQEMLDIHSFITERAPADADIAGEMQRYRDNYLRLAKAVLAAKSRTASSFITGGSNFPEARNRKRLATEHRRVDEFLEWRKKARNAIRKKFAPEESKAVSSSDPEAISKLRKKLEAAEQAQERMKAANKIVRSKKLSHAEKVQSLQDDAGLSEEQARDLLKPDFAGRPGFPQYALSNNNAEIKRLRDRISALEARKETAEAVGGSVTVQFEGGQVEVDYEGGYVRVQHDQKPSAEVRQALKSGGFRWAPSEGAWRRKLSNQALFKAGQITGAELPSDSVGDGEGLYSVEARRGPYNPDQADLFAELEAIKNDDPYENAETRPGANQRQLDAGRSALRDLFRWLEKLHKRAGADSGSRGSAPSLLGASIYKNFKAGKPNQLVGQTIRGPGDLAALAQVYRDPRFETFRVFYLDGKGKILLENTSSTRLPASVNFTDSLYDDIRESADRVGAKGVYILHNHPSGSSEPSHADVVITRTFQDQLGELFKGHVVIDTNEYTLIRGDGTQKTTVDENLKSVDFKSNPERPHPVLGRSILNPVAMARVGKDVAEKDNVVVVATAAGRDGNVALLASIPMDMIRRGMSSAGAKSQIEFVAIMRRMAREAGAGGRLYAVLPESADTENTVYQWMHQYFQDVVDSEGRSVIRITDGVDLDGIIGRSPNVGMGVVGWKRKRAPLREDTAGYGGAINAHTPDTLRTAMQSAFKGVGKALEDGGLLKVITKDQIPVSLSRDDVASAGGRIQAFVKDGVVHMVADNISRDTDVKGLMMHEIGVHLTKLGRSDTEFQSILRQLESLHKSGNKTVAKAYRRALSAFGIDSFPGYGVAQGIDTDAIKLSDTIRAAASVKKIADDIGAVLGSSVGRRVGTGIGQNASDVGWDAANRLADFFEGGPTFTHGDGSIDIDALASMLSLVRGSVQDVEVLNSVVRLAPVDVVNVLLGRKSPSDMGLHDVSMFVDLDSIDVDQSVSEGANRAIAVAVSVAHSARLTAKPLGGAGVSVENGSAPLARDINSSTADSLVSMGSRAGTAAESLSSRLDLFFALNTMAGTHGAAPDSSVVLGGGGVGAPSSLPIISKSLFWEEVLGYTAEISPNMPLVKRILSWFRAKLREWGGKLKGLNRARFMKWANDLSADDLVYMAQSATRQAANVKEARQAEGVMASEQRITDTPAFRRWFGDSKVVDESGEPLVVYHGTPDGRFVGSDGVFMGMSDRYGEQRGVGAFWFAKDRTTANSYADDRRAWDYQNAEPGIIPAYLKLENPLIVEGAGKEWREAQAIGKTTNVIEKAQAEGYDGVIIRNVRDHYNNNPRTRATDTYVVFNSKQIKSADNNAGTFDPNNPDIRYSRARHPFSLSGNNPSDSSQTGVTAQSLLARHWGEDPAESVQAAIQAAKRENLPDVVDWLKVNRDRVQSAPSGQGDVVFSRADDSLTEAEAAREEMNRRVREEHHGTWFKAKGALRRYFAPGGLLPEPVFKAKIKRDSQMGAEEMDIEFHVGGLEHAFRKDYGKSFDQRTKDEEWALADALAGHISDEIPEGTRKAIEAMRQHIDTLSGRYVQILEADAQQLLESLPEDRRSAVEQAIRDESTDGLRQNELQVASKLQLMQTIGGNIGEYVHRSYRAFDDPMWPRNVPSPVLNNARDYLEARYLEQNEGASQVEAAQAAQRVINDILKKGTAFDSMEAFIRETKLGHKDLSLLKRRKVIAPEIRALMGEHQDPRVNFAKTATKMSRLIHNDVFLKRVREVGMGIFLFEEGQQPEDGFTATIAADSSEAYAPLNGLRTTPEVNQAFIDALGKEQLGPVFKKIVQMNGAVKFGKTVLSPTTAARNFMSAYFFTMANGHFNMRHTKKSLESVGSYFKRRGDAFQYLKRLKQLGVIYDTPYAGEMMRLLEDTDLQDRLLNGRMGAQEALNFFQRVYQVGDDWWKVIGFENEVDLQMRYRNIAREEAEVIAAERIRDTYPTYSMTGKFVNHLRRFPLAGTFVSFPAEIIRTTFNMLKYAKEDMQHSRALGMRRVTGLAAVSAFAYAAQELSKHLLDVDDEEEEAIRNQAPSWSQNSNMVFLSREDGNLKYLDVSFLDPYNYWKRPITAIMRDDVSLKDTAIQSAAEMLAPFFGTDIAFGALAEIWSNKKATGGRVYNESDTAMEQTADIANHLRKAIQPGAFANAERLLKAAVGEKTTYGKEYTMSDELAALVGFRVSTLDPVTSLRFRTFEASDSLRDATSILSRVARDPNPVDDEDLRETFDRVTGIRKDIYTDLLKSIKAARKSGLDDKAIFRQLQAGGLSKRDAAILTRGRIPPRLSSKQYLMSAIRSAGDTLGPEVQKEMSRRRLQILRWERQEAQQSQQ